MPIANDDRKDSLGDGSGKPFCIRCNGIITKVYKRPLGRKQYEHVFYCPLCRYKQVFSEDNVVEGA